MALVCGQMSRITMIPLIGKEDGEEHLRILGHWEIILMGMASIFVYLVLLILNFFNGVYPEATN